MRSLAVTIITACLLLMAGCTDDTPASTPGDDAADTAADVTDVEPDADADSEDDDVEDSSGEEDATEDTTDTVSETPTDTVLGPDDRPAELLLPDDYDASGNYPLIILLHGYGMSGDGVDTYFEVVELRHARQFLVVAPDGTRDTTGQRFWSATDYCCDYYDANPNDAEYLIALVDEAIDRFAVDPASVYFAGFSNGGFMAYRMACDYPSRVAGIASVSGSSFDDADACGATDGGPRILHAHGTGDTVVGYYGTLS
ncbi:MAG: alpha/beta hydrolase family esterase, partial [Myxococcota bacterium]